MTQLAVKLFRISHLHHHHRQSVFFSQLTELPAMLCYTELSAVRRAAKQGLCTFVSSNLVHCVLHAASDMHVAVGPCRSRAQCHVESYHTSDNENLPAGAWFIIPWRALLHGHNTRQQPCRYDALCLQHIDPALLQAMDDVLGGDMLCLC